MSYLKIAPIVGALCVCATSAPAGIITLSTHSLDQTDPSILDATLEMTVAGHELTLIVTNATAGESSYYVNQVFFNGSDNVAGLDLTSGPPGWQLAYDKKVGGFGVFDFALLGSVGEHAENLTPGQSASFIFEVLGSVAFSDFVSPNDKDFVAAVKFVAGPRGDSATGGVTSSSVPAPGALTLLCIAAGLTVRTRRKRPG